MKKLFLIIFLILLFPLSGFADYRVISLPVWQNQATVRTQWQTSSAFFIGDMTGPLGYSLKVGVTDTSYPYYVLKFNTADDKNGLFAPDSDDPYIGGTVSSTSGTHENGSHSGNITNVTAQWFTVNIIELSGAQAKGNGNITLTIFKRIQK